MKITVCTDLSSLSYQAVLTAKEMSDKFSGELTILHCINNLDISLYTGLSFFDQYNWEPKDSQEIEIKNKIFEDLEKMDPNFDKKAVNLKFLYGYPEEKISLYTEENETDLLVIGLKGHNLWDRITVGSVANKLISHTRCNIMAIHKNLKGQPKNMLFATDFSKTSNIPYQWSQKLQDNWQNQLTLYYALTPASVLFHENNQPCHSIENLLEQSKPYAEENLEKLKQSLKNPEKANIFVELSQELSIPKLIKNYLEKNQIDLAILGATREEGIHSWLLGSNAQNLVNDPPCSIFLARKTD